MTALMRLIPDGARLVTPELASGERDRWKPEEFEPLVAKVSRELRLDSLDAALDHAISSWAPHDPAMDAQLAPLVHRHLPLTLREASEIGVFRFLAVVHRPDVVRHRWDAAVWGQARSRFLTAGTRPDSNAFYRWWWIAELTRVGADYSLTERVLRRQSLATAIFARSLSFHRPAVRACIAALEDCESSVIERSMLEMSRWLALVRLESLDEATIAAELQQIMTRLS